MENRPAIRPKSALMLALLLALLVASTPGVAQVCSAGNVVLASQAEVDSFQADYGPCDDAPGTLTVSGADITNLAGLSALVNMTGLRIDSNPLLTDLDDLSALTTLLELWITGNSQLADIDGLSGLTSVGNNIRVVDNSTLQDIDGLANITGLTNYLVLENNSALLHVDGLSALTSVGGNLTISGNAALANLDGLSALTSVGGELSIYMNGALTSIAGLSQLTSVTELRIQESDALTNLNGLQGVTSVDRLNIPFNDVLANVDGLSSLMSVGSEVNITGNPALTNLDGLSALGSAGGNFLIQSNGALADVGGLSSLTSIGGYLVISNNDSLTNVDGFSSLTSVGDTLDISGNDALLNLDGFSLLISVGNDVEVINNSALALCSGLEVLLDDVDDGAPGPGPGTAGIPDVGDEVVLSGNLPGCNSLGEIFNEPATFLVTKSYSDGNLDAVEVTLTCNTGLPLTQSFMISDGEPVNFVVTNFAQGAMDCEVTESGTADGYTPSYDNGSIVSTTSCAYVGVVSGAYACAIANDADPATFIVTKQWVLSGAEADVVVQEANVAIYCNNEIEGGSWNGSYYVLGDVLVGDGDSLVASVDTTLQSAQCWAEEDIVESGVETESDCGQRTIPAGGSSSCTIVNTVFFEGIPTLSHWGLALMALLMLGVGVIGVRRLA